MKHILSGKDLSGKLIYLFSILISVLMILEVFAGLDDKKIYIYFNSDTLYLPSIFRDLFIDHSGFRGWHLNGAPNFFPDMLFYFAVNAFIPDFRSAMVVYSILQYLVLLILARWLFKSVFPDITEEALAAGNLIILVIFLVSFYPGDFVFTFYLFSISYHLGAFLMTLASLALTFRYLKNGRTLNLVILFVLTLLGVINDKLFIAMYILPLLSLIVFLPEKTLRKKLLVLFSNAVIVSFAGTLIYNGIKHSGFVHIISLSWKFMNFSNIPASFHTMTGQHLTYLKSGDFRSLTIILSILSFLATTFYAIRFLIHFFRNRQLPESNRLPALYMVFAAAFWLIVLATPVINGSYVGYAILRYNVYAIYLSLLNFSVLFFFWSKEKHRKLSMKVIRVAFILLFLLPAVFCGKPFIQHGLKKVTGYYPEIVREMDNLAKKENLHYGLATYWHAKYITMFSHTGLRIYTVYDDLTPWYHVTNENWYHKGGKGRYGNPEFTFVFMDGMDPERVERKLGPPLLKIPFSGSSLQIYPPFCFNENKQPLFYHQE